MVPLGSILVSFGRPWAPSGPTFATLGEFVENGCHFAAKVESILAPFSDKNPEKSQKVVKSGCPESSQEKSRHRNSPGVAQCGIHTVIAICFEGSSLVPSGGFWVTFGYLLGSLLATLGSKWPVWGAKKRSKKSDQKKVRKGHAGILVRGLYGPKRVPTRPQPEAQEPRSRSQKLRGQHSD